MYACINIKYNHNRSIMPAQEKTILKRIQQLYDGEYGRTEGKKGLCPCSCVRRKVCGDKDIPTGKKCIWSDAEAARFRCVNPARLKVGAVNGVRPIHRPGIDPEVPKGTRTGDPVSGGAKKIGSEEGSGGETID